MPLSFTPEGYLPARHPKRLARQRAERIRQAEPVDRTRYNVDRLYFNRPGYRKRILSSVTLAQAQEWCSDLNSSSSTAWTTSAIRRTKRYGPWFDSYTEAK